MIKFFHKCFLQVKVFFLKWLPYLYIPSLFFNTGLIINDERAYYGGHYLNYLQFRITLSLLIGGLLALQHYKKSKYAFPLGLILLSNILLHSDSLSWIALFKAGVFIVKVFALFISLKYYLCSAKDPLIIIVKNFLLIGVLVLQSMIVLWQYFAQNFIDFLPLYWLGQSKASYVGGNIAYIDSLFLGESGDLIMRSYGTLPHPNILAGLSLLSFILLFPTRKIFYYGWILSGLALGIILFTTFSKTSMLVLVILLFIWQMEYLWGAKRDFFLKKLTFFTFFLKKERSLFRIFLLFLGVMIINFGIVGGTWLFNKWIYFEFSYVRALLNGGAGEIIRLFPIRGVGWYHFMPYLIDHNVLFDYQAKFVQPVHNIWLLILVELGLLFSLGLFGSLIYLWEKIAIVKTKTKAYLFIWLIILGGFDHYIVTYILG